MKNNKGRMKDQITDMKGPYCMLVFLIIFLVIIPGIVSGNQPPEDNTEKLFTLMDFDHTKIYFDNIMFDAKDHTILSYANV